jgi:hypothetical protein
MVSMPPEELALLGICPPPHSTGGSVDVILVEKSKIDVDSDYWLRDAIIDFGADFDEMTHPEYRDTRSYTEFYEKSDGNEAALDNRRLLYNVMTQAGFTNYPFEYWHYDFGNQFHALSSGNNVAFYGFAGGVNEGRIVEDLTDEEVAFKSYAEITGMTEETAKLFRPYFGLAA